MILPNVIFCRRFPLPLCVLAVVFMLQFAGCGTMKTSNTSRTATEQLLVSDAIDRAITEIDFSVLAGKKIFLDVAPLPSGADSNYLASSIRQQVLACGALLMEERKSADYIVEVRSGAIGTDEHEVVYGIPEITTPTFVSSGSITIPEIALAKRKGQRANAKIAVFAYNRTTGLPLWQSGMHEKDSNVKNLWVLGGGPYRTGDIIEKPQLIDSSVSVPLADLWDKKTDNVAVSVRDQAYFVQNDADKNRAKQSPVLRLKSAPENQTELAGAITHPEGINIPTQQQLAILEKEKAAQDSKAELASTDSDKQKSDEQVQPEGKTPEEKAQPVSEIASNPDSTIK